MLKPVRPVTHCWCQGALLPFCWGRGSCGGASWIFRKALCWWGRRDPGIPRGTGSSEATPGALSHPKVPLGSAWTFLSQSHEESSGTTLSGETKPLPEAPQGRSGELPLIPPFGLEFLPVAWTSSSPWSRGWQDPRSGAWCLPSTLSPVLGTLCDFSGVQERFPPSHRMPVQGTGPLEWGYWPSWWNSAGAWNVITAAL